ncbi:MAG: CotH kinase family protein [Chloroflexota bacterium]|nr:CotH kinase family protein [Chloroflexota bacterium]
MWRSSRILPAVLSIVILLATASAGCQVQAVAQLQIPPSNQEAFITDRVAEVRIVMSEKDWEELQAYTHWEPAPSTTSQTPDSQKVPPNILPKEEYVLADFWFDGELVPDVAVRPKGNASFKFVIKSGNPRLSFKVDFNRFYPSRTFRGVKKLNFHNGYRDPSLIRERLAYELFDQMGLPTPHVSHVDLWVNDTHMGLYTQVEQVDKTFLRNHFGRDDGNLYKPAWPSALLNWTEEDLIRQRTERLKGISASVPQPTPGSKQPIRKPPTASLPEAADKSIPPPSDKPPKPYYDLLRMMQLQTNERFPDHTDLFHLLKALNRAPDEAFPTELEQVLDVDAVLRYVAVCSITGNLDSYLGFGHNYYLYDIDGRFTIIPWDLNEAFGSFRCGGLSRQSIINFYIDEPTCDPLDQRPMIKLLLSYPPYLECYHRYLEQMLDGPFDIERMHNRIDETAHMVRPYVEADELKFFSTADFERNLTQDVKHHIGLKVFVVQRSQSVRKQLAGVLPAGGDGSSNVNR